MILNKNIYLINAQYQPQNRSGSARISQDQPGQARASKTAKYQNWTNCLNFRQTNYICLIGVQISYPFGQKKDP